VVRARRFPMVLALLGVGLALALAACGGSDADSDGGDRQVTLKFLTGEAENARDQAAMDAVIDRFNDAHPGVRVKIEAVPVNDLRTVLRTRLVSGAGPDVFGYDAGSGYGGVLAKAGLVLPLDDAYEKNGWKIYPWARSRATYGGKTYGVPDSVEELGVFYNADLFAKLGVQPPATIQDLEHIADLAKQQGLIPLAYGDKDGWPGSHLFSMAVSNAVGRQGLDRILYDTGRWDDPQVVSAIDVFFRQFADKGYLPTGANGIGYDDANALFYAGKAAMLPTGTWLVSDLAQKATFKVGFFPFPSLDGSTATPPAGVGMAWFVSAKSKHQAEAIEFLNYMVSDQAAKQRIETLSTIPAFNVDTSGLKVSPLFKEVLTDLGQAQDDQAFGYNLDALTPASFNDVMYSGFQEVLGGKRTPQQQAANLQAAWETAKQAGDVLEKP
jgi:raffinose/stachyose/melibiose transport system substrate-binding protein